MIEIQTKLQVLNAITLEDFQGCIELRVNAGIAVKMFMKTTSKRDGGRRIWKYCELLLFYGQIPQIF